MAGSTRREEVEALVVSVRSALFDLSFEPDKDEEERSALFDLTLELGKADKDLARTAHDDEVTIIERDRLRPIVFRLQRFALRKHLTLARPLWGWTHVAPNANRVAYAGGEEIRDVLERVCTDRQLEISDSTRGGDIATVVWNQMREAGFAVFDLTAEDRREWAPVCFRLGLALSLGRYPIVIAREGADVPFNIAVEITRLAPDSDRAETIGRAVDRASYGVLATSGGDSVQQTVARALPLCAGDDATTSVLRRELERADHVGPLKARAYLDKLLETNAPDRCTVINPAWPGAYPDERERRCFHVMPFTEDWSDEVRDEVNAVCESAGVLYRRGDDAENFRVIPSIWEQICKASHVVVDITGQNPNVCLELAMVLALGRPVLLLARGGAELEEKNDGGQSPLFAEISKLQVEEYPEDSLAKLVGDFLTR